MCGHAWPPLHAPKHDNNKTEERTMKNITRHTGTLRLIERMKNSSNGNPQFMLWIDQGNGTGWKFRTPANSMMAYGIDGYLDKKVTVTIGTHYGCATLDSVKTAQA
jgi:hypothetical protein